MALGPEHDLPFSSYFDETAQYVDSLISLAESNDLLKTLCGGVHILDFFTNEPDLYAQILPKEWRTFISSHDIVDFLDLLLREPLDQIDRLSHEPATWRGGPAPPASLVGYISEVRRHFLIRQPAASQCSRNRTVKSTQKIARRVAAGMNVKKVHEVGLFAQYVDELTTSLSAASGSAITHLVDFGSGQNYLGRTLASLPYSKNIVAIETKGHNQERAKYLDKMAGLSVRERHMFDRQQAKLGRPYKNPSGNTTEEMIIAKIEPAAEGVGAVQYVEHYILDGDLKHVVEQIRPDSTSIDQDRSDSGSDKNLLVMSLHSCGNLVHHGLRSLVMNNSVKAVALVGCCYNLITERLSPATYKLPELRPAAHPRVEAEAMACDPHGFPMSERLCKATDAGMRLNITARMMAVHAPGNWGDQDSESFFTRHFYRALLQRIFLDKGVVGRPTPDCVGGSPLGHSSGTPIIIGSLRKACYTSFTSYVRGALAKLGQDPERGHLFQDKLADLSDAEIQRYEHEYRHRKKDLSAIWSLMAFSACVVEALIVTDRYLWLKEQDEVKEAWVEPLFDYAISPRNLVVVGIKE